MDNTDRYPKTWKVIVYVVFLALFLRNAVYLRIYDLSASPVFSDCFVVH